MNDDRRHSPDDWRPHPADRDTGRDRQPQDPADSDETVILPRNGARRGYSANGSGAEPTERPANGQDGAQGVDSERTRGSAAVPPYSSGSFDDDAADSARTQVIPPVGRSQPPVDRVDRRSGSQETPHTAAGPERTQVTGAVPTREPRYGQPAQSWQGHFVGAGEDEAAEAAHEQPPHGRSTNKILLRVLQVLAAFLILFIGVGIGTFVSGTPVTGSTPAATTTVTSTATTTATTTATPTTAATTAPPATVTQTETLPAQTVTVAAPAQTVTVPAPAQTVTVPAPAQTVTVPGPTTTITPDR